MKTSLKILLILITLLSNTNFAKAELFNAKEFHLKNGLRVIVAPNHKSPIIKHMIWYKTGSIDETQGKTGLAHLNEHLMFRGTSEIPNNKFNEIISQYGGNSNAFTMQDFTSYHQFIDQSKLELAMYMEADRMQNLNFSKEEFEKERNIVFQERLQNTDNDPNQLFLEKLNHIFWQKHKYRHPIVGYERDIKNLSYNDVKEFYEKHYIPNNAILVLSGDIDLKTAKKLAVKYYGDIDKGENLEKQNFNKLNNKFSSKIKEKNEKVTTSKIIKKYLADSYNTKKENIYKISVLNKIVADGETSLLNKKFVLEENKAIAVGANYNPYKRDYASINTYIIPKDNNKAEELEIEFDRYLTNIDQKITRKLVEEAKDKILSSLIYVRDNPSDAGKQIGLMASAGMSIDEIENWNKSIENVSYLDVKNIAKEIFQNSTKSTGIITPEAK